MQDCLQHSRRPAPTLPACDDVRALQRDHPASFSIRVLAHDEAVCDVCRTATGAGAVGHLHDRPICDRCLLERCDLLGMIVALVSVTRAFATTTPADAEAERELLADLGMFARVFEHVAARWGPPRSIRELQP